MSSLKKYLPNFKNLQRSRVLNFYVIYDVFGAEQESWEKLQTVLLDAVADTVHTSNPAAEESSWFAM